MSLEEGAKQGRETRGERNPPSPGSGVPRQAPHTCSEVQGAENPNADTSLASGVSESATNPAQPLLIWVTLGKH